MVLGGLAASLQVLMHLKVSATGRPPQGFEDAESLRQLDSLEVMALTIKERGVLVVQGSGIAVTAADSDLRKPVPPRYAIQIGQPVLLEPDGSASSNHSVVVIAAATVSRPIPGLEVGQCLVIDQDPHRVCIREALEQAGLGKTPPHQLTPVQIKEAGVDHLMTRVVSFDELLRTRGTGNLGIFPMGGMCGGRFFVPQRTLAP